NYVGAVYAAAFADLGNQVYGVDIDERKVQLLSEGISPIYEPGLDELVTRNLKAGRLRFTTCYDEAVPVSEFVFICVGTPSSFSGEADMRAARSAAEMIGTTIPGHTMIINQVKSPDATFAVVSNPEFLREGSAVQDVFNPSRIVLGAEDREAAERVAELYSALNAPVLITDRRTAEMIKYASNAILATRI